MAIMDAKEALRIEVEKRRSRLKLDREMLRQLELTLELLKSDQFQMSPASAPKRSAGGKRRRTPPAPEGPAPVKGAWIAVVAEIFSDGEPHQLAEVVERVHAAGHKVTEKNIGIYLARAHKKDILRRTARGTYVIGATT